MAGRGTLPTKRAARERSDPWDGSRSRPYSAARESAQDDSAPREFPSVTTDLFLRDRAGNATVSNEPFRERGGVLGSEGTDVRLVVRGERRPFLLSRGERKGEERQDAGQDEPGTHGQSSE